MFIAWIFLVVSVLVFLNHVRALLYLALVRDYDPWGTYGLTDAQHIKGWVSVAVMLICTAYIIS